MTGCQMLMTKIINHKMHYFWTVDLLNTLQILGQTSLISILDLWT